MEVINMEYRHQSETGETTRAVNTGVSFHGDNLDEIVGCFRQFLAGIGYTEDTIRDRVGGE